MPIGTVVVARDASEVARRAAEWLAGVLADTIALEGRASLALSGGRTPLEAYGLLAEDRSVDWRRVHLFWADERAVPADHARSNYGGARTVLIDPAAVPAAHVHRMPADRADLDAAAVDYERALAEPLDALVLGIGADGHTASLFPGDPALRVRDRSVVAVAPHDDLEARLTLTPAAIERARHVLVLATGAEKRAPLQRVFSDEGRVEDTPARVMLSCQGAVVWMMDEAAAPPSARQRASFAAGSSPRPP